MNVSHSRAYARAAARRPACAAGFKPSTLLALLCACLSPAINAAQQLEPMVITSVLPSSPHTVSTDPKIPRQPAPASDAGDYLLTIPGFSAVRGGGSNSDPVFRGMFGSRLNMLADGSQLLGACPSRMDSPSAYISPQNYDQLTVIKGPQTVLWGPGGSAATILFEREPVHFDAPTAQAEGSVLTGSNGRFEQALDATLGSSPGYIRALVNRSKADDYKDGDGNRVHSSWDKWSSDLLLGWTPSANSLLELSVGASDGEAAYAGRGMDGRQFRRDSLALRFRHEPVGEVLQRIDARLFYTYADHIMDNFSLRTPAGTGMMAGPMASAVDRRVLGGRLAGTWSWQDYSLQAGLDGQRNEHRKRNSRYNMMSGAFSDADNFSWSKDAAFKNAGVFAELTRSLDEQRRVVGGARLDHVNAEDFRADSSGPKSRSDNLPSAFVRYEHDFSSLPGSASIGLGHSQRFADYWELFSPNRGVSLGSSAFQTVEPEKTTQLDIGLQVQQGPVELWGSAYVGQVHNYILFNYLPGGMGMTTSVAENVDARIMGAELGGAYRLNSTWKADVSLAYAWAKNTSQDRAMPQIPPLEARLGLTYQHAGWSAGALWRGVSAQRRIAEGQGNVTSRDFAESAGFAVFSLNAAYTVSQHLTLSSGIDNLFNRAYSEHLNQAGNAGFGYAASTRINEPGRTGWLRADLRF